MTGTILNFNIQEGAGVISGDDGQRYNFTSTEWKTEASAPQQNQKVDFEAGEENTAKNIYAVQNQQAATQQVIIQGSRTSTAAIISLVFGILGFFSSWWLFGIPSLVAVITGHVARANVKNSNGDLEGSGLALAGLIMGYIVLAFYLLIVIGLVGALAVGASNSY